MRRRAAFFPEQGDFTDCPVLSRYSLSPGDVIDGPALIEERESTCVIGAGDRLTVDVLGNLVVEIALHESIAGEP